MTYTEKEVKAAFWKTFHKMGEFWFDCFDGSPSPAFPQGERGSEKECEQSTQEEWGWFLENLKATK
ncbi:hypothetical protein LCGC14_2984740 [marine sediment metagenome]|uniref:Uncharacterized protein n=1 Tax=marine sediment metagenome TaxID=412755 RepID=A0A0F8ZD32_9ZZZZ